MSILIKGMEMPKNCGECFACKAEMSHEKKVIHVCCFTRKEYGFDGNHMDDCPLVPVPQHGRLIDADAFFKDICDSLNEMTAICVAVDGDWMWGKLNDALINATTIIPAEEEEPSIDESIPSFLPCIEMYEPTYDPETGAM